jgi:hypothetical protein
MSDDTTGYPIAAHFATFGDMTKEIADLKADIAELDEIYDMLSDAEADNAKLREQLAKADQHIKLHCSDLASSIIRGGAIGRGKEYTRPIGTTTPTGPDAKGVS